MASSAEDVGEGRPVGAGRVAALERLVELLRIAEQDDARRLRRRHREDVRQRDLARLVDEEHVEGPLLRVADAHSHAVPADEVASPPAMPAADVGRLHLSDPWIVDDARPRRPSAGSARTSAPDPGSLAARSTSGSRLAITLWLVPVIPTRLAGREEGADHPRAGVGLA